tara:strand:+ start:159 stop:512 length:354 start_codon:yes stop_codon:yes gene_type:complete
MENTETNNDKVNDSATEWKSPLEVAGNKQVYVSEEASNLVWKLRNIYLDRIENREWKQDSQDVMEADLLVTSIVSGLLIKHLNRMIGAFDTTDEMNEYISTGEARHPYTSTDKEMLN